MLVALYKWKVFLPAFFMEGKDREKQVHLSFGDFLSAAFGRPQGQAFRIRTALLTFA